MRLSFSMLMAALTACLVAVSMAAPIIVTDLTSGNVFTLPLGYPGTLYDAQFNTNSASRVFQRFTNQPTVLGSTLFPMNMSSVLLNVTWAGDISDTFTFAIPANLTVQAVAGSAAGCNVQTQTVLSAQLQSCFYNLSWTGPFQGTFSVVYVNSSFPVGSETIALTFVNQAIVTGDPQFVGLRGQSYQVHGIDGAVYNLITEQTAQVNSRFVFLTEGECPIINGVAANGCWSHPGSYMGDLAFQALVDGKVHTAFIAAGDAKKGFAEVLVDEKPLALGAKAAFGSFVVQYTSKYGVSVQLDNYAVELANSDKFLNLALTARVPLSQLKSHGLIGQTHANKVYKQSSVRYIEGEVDDYLIADNDSFGNDFPFNRFNQ